MNMHEKIKRLRKQHNLTLEQVGNIVGVSKSTVRKWENGDIANMRRDKIASLAKALHTTPAYLMGWEEKTPDDPKADERKAELLEVFNSLPKETQDKFLNILRYLQGEQPKP